MAGKKIWDAIGSIFGKRKSDEPAGVVEDDQSSEQSAHKDEEVVQKEMDSLNRSTRESLGRIKSLNETRAREFFNTVKGIIETARRGGLDENKILRDFIDNPQCPHDKKEFWQIVDAVRADLKRGKHEKSN